MSNNTSGEAAGTNTTIVVRAADGTWRDVDVCTNDTAAEIGANVMAAIRGERLFQLSTRVWPDREREIARAFGRLMARNAKVGAP